MASSFFRRPEPELYTGTQVFATKISATPTAFGLTAEQAADYSALNILWRAAYEVANDPEQRTTGKVATKNNLKHQIRAMSSMLAAIVEATPTVTDEQKLDLGLNVRKIPEPVAAPGTPYAFTVVLNGSGGLTAGWKCDNPPGAYGVFYSIFRRNGPTDPYEFLGISGQRKFIDDSIPAGSSQITYKIQAGRTTGPGTPAEFNVNFGIGGSGSMTASVTPVKIAG